MIETDLLELDGIADRIIFRNDTNGYTVIDVRAGDEIVPAVGNMPWINAGENLQLFGRWGSHPEFGAQFLVESYKRSMPSTCDLIVKYLSSDMIKGVGLQTATKLVNKFKEDTISIIKNSPHEMCFIKGINEEKANNISKQLNTIISISDMSEYLNKYGVLSEEVVKIYKILGDNYLKEIEKNPYILCMDSIGVDFNKVDIIAQDIKASPKDVNRIKAGILYILKHNTNNGHTCLPIKKLIPVTSNFLNLESELIEDSIEEMINNREIVLEKINNIEFLFLSDMYDSETYCALRVKMLLKSVCKNIGNINEKIREEEELNRIEYASLQKEAIQIAASKGLLILTGGPGTGKTTTLKAIIDILEKNDEKIFLSAPTGRAAQRMSEITGREAKTIHRMLEVCWNSTDNPTFNKNEKHLLNCDTLIIDEMSMVDLKLFEGVLRAVPMGCRFIIVGDCNQLMSISAGNVLNDLISSDIIPVVQLKEIFRQSQKSLIVMNAHKIVNNEIPELGVKDNDFFFLPIYSAAKVKSTIIDLCQRRLPKTYGYSPIYDIQVITPGRKGLLGTESLNLGIQEAINPRDGIKKEVKLNGILLRENDKVMQTKNNYNIYWEKANGTQGEGIYNGDIGIILEIDLKSSHIVIKYDDKIAVYEFEVCNNLDLAYAVTVHKSQGSEFESVIIPILGENPKLYYRNLLYTAVTRAKSKLIILGSEEYVEKMVKNDARSKRYSALCKFLEE